jgi:ABC-type Fe3+/spermidine/putrescine transport system ATPase subunit
MPDDKFLSLQGVTKHYDDVVALSDLSVDIRRGELVSFVGPSGCGKTTLLRCIGGFVEQTAGTIELDGKTLDGLPPDKRPTGMVFQAYALFPHMTVWQNVAYGLRMAKVPRGDRDRRVEEALESVHLTGYGRRKPRELSGGQQQRVALARCLVLRPKVLLLDEPLSNLDANLRVIMRDEIKRLKDELDLTIVFVTHDQDEALSISDRLLVLRDGHLQQVGIPEDVYQRPSNAFVARFVGDANLMRGTVTEEDGQRWLLADGVRTPFDHDDVPTGSEITAMWRPEGIEVGDDGHLRGRITHETYHGRYVRYLVALNDEVELVVDQDVSDSRQRRETGDEVALRLWPKPHVLPADAVESSGAALQIQAG